MELVRDGSEEEKLRKVGRSLRTAFYKHKRVPPDT